MNIKYAFFITLLALGVASCGQTTTTDNSETQNSEAITDNTEHTTNGEGDDIMVTKEEQKMAQLEALNQWKTIVDGSQGAFTAEKLEYACDGWGGEVQLTKENDKLRAIAVLSGGEHGHNVEKFYFDEHNALVMVSYEEGEWVMDQDKIALTLYYVSDNTPFYVVQKKVEGKSDQIETLFAKAEMTEIELNADAFNELAQKLPDYKNLTTENVNEFFCN